MFQLLDNFEMGEIEVFVDISESPFNFANMSSKNIENLSASKVTLTRYANTVYWGFVASHSQIIRAIR